MENIYKDYIDYKTNILINEKELHERIKELALEISLDYRDKHILLIGILKGATMFMMDISRFIIVPVTYDFISVVSYDGLASTGEIKILKDITDDIKGKHVIIVDDICDTGLTLKYVKHHLLTFNPATLNICVLLYKQNKKKYKVDIKYKGFAIPDKYVIGYGLDYKGKYRNLPSICVLKEENI
ncbi:MAG: hypoxanthine phosphoribosyltransferase [bacterium]